MAGQVRIVGLVRAADVVRRELSGPVTTERRERLRQIVNDNLDQVQRILQRNAARLRDLPAPSQRAYQFLADVQWSKIPTIESTTLPAAPKTILAWNGMRAFLDRMLNRLATEQNEAAVSLIGDEIARASQKMESTIQVRGVAPDGLSAVTREQRGWLRFFSEDENLMAYWHARMLASRLIDAGAAGSKHYPPPVTIHFCPMRGIYRLSATPGGPVLRLPTPMMSFDEEAFSHLAGMVFGRGKHSRRIVIAQMTGEDYQAVRAELESLGGFVEQVRGAAHDLGESFDRVNAAYFRGEMPRPRLTWNRTFTGRKFGHYDWVNDTVMVSRTLDSQAVPRFVVDFIVFHELLHKFHGLRWVNGRGYAHTTEFKQNERQFAQYHDADAILEKLARAVR